MMLRKLINNASIYVAIILALSFMMRWIPGNYPASAQTEANNWRHVRTIYTAELGAPRPASLAFSPAANAFLILNAQPGTPSDDLAIISMYADPMGSIRLPELLNDPLNLAFDSLANRLLAFNPATSQLIEFQAGPSGLPEAAPQAVSRSNARQFGLRSARGMTFDPENGRLFILDATASRILRISPHPLSRFDGESAAREGRIASIDLRHLRAGDLRGIAYHPGNRHLYLLDAAQQQVYELAGDGRLVSVRDLSELNLQDPQGMLIAPSVDRTDDPETMDLFILDSGTTSQGGQMIEISLVAPMALPPGTTLLPATLVRTVDTSKAAWNPSSPDPAGITYRPLTGRLLVVDSEVEEMPPYWQGKNVFDATTSGTLVDTCTTYTSGTPNGAWNNYSTEPTGIAINPNNNFIYISDDSGGGKLHEIRPGPDGIYCTPDD
ncbi:MAG: hypothetical protein QXQ53_02970, partial [Candidatus Methanosuratincola sp.]